MHRKFLPPLFLTVFLLAVAYGLASTWKEAGKSWLIIGQPKLASSWHDKTVQNIQQACPPQTRQALWWSGAGKRDALRITRSLNYSAWPVMLEAVGPEEVMGAPKPLFCLPKDDDGVALWLGKNSRSAWSQTRAGHVICFLPGDAETRDHHRPSQETIGGDEQRTRPRAGIAKVLAGFLSFILCLGLLSLAKKKPFSLWSAGWAFPLWMGFMTMAVFGALLAGTTLNTALGVAAILFILAQATGRHGLPPSQAFLPSSGQRVFGWRNHGLLLALAVAAVLLGVMAMAHPVWQPAARGVWGIKAKILVESGNLPWEVWTGAAAEAHQPGHPPGFPLLMTFLAKAAGGWNDWVPGLASWLGWVCLAMLGFGLSTSPAHRLAWLSCCLLPVSIRLATNGTSDLWWACLASAGLWSRAMGWQSENRRARMFGVVLLGMSAWFKREGEAFLLLALAAEWAVSRKKVGWREWLPGIALAGIWPLFCLAQGIRHQDLSWPSLANFSVALQRLGPEAGRILWGWQGVWLLGIILCLLHSRKRAPCSTEHETRLVRRWLLSIGAGWLMLSPMVFLWVKATDFEWTVFVRSTMDRLWLPGMLALSLAALVKLDNEKKAKDIDKI